MQWQSLLQQVRYAGRYATDAEADRVLRAVLAVLGGQLGGADRADLTRLLPREAATVLTGRTGRPLAARAFVEAVAARLSPMDRTQARWAAGTVLTVLAQHAGRPLTRRVLDGLPRGYALLFGQAELAPATAA
ncbi:DUF2267 domain-containing protein [Streptomyces sp. NPDC020965]|uniref:DUF2267 domain-containing protein n=1 Tax=Streptomyces sp. NPDC020965 TaxID=3365105 RepID=UPI0037B9EC44